MNEIEIRLECLRLAFTRDQDKRIDIANTFFNFVRFGNTNATTEAVTARKDEAQATS